MKWLYLCVSYMCVLMDSLHCTLVSIFADPAMHSVDFVQPLTQIASVRYRGDSGVSNG